MNGLDCVEEKKNDLSLNQYLVELPNVFIQQIFIEQLFVGQAYYQAEINGQ